MLKSIPKSDISFRNFKVYKEWNFTQADYPVITATLSDYGYFDSSSATTSQGFYQCPLYDSIKHKYYTNDGNVLHLFGTIQNIGNSSLERVIGDSISVIPISQSNYGEGIKPGSVILTDTDNEITYYDNSYGGLDLENPTYNLVSVDMDEETIVISDRVTEYSGSIFSYDANTGAASIYFNQNTESLEIAYIDFDIDKVTFSETIFITGSGYPNTVVVGNVSYGEGLIVVSDSSTFSNYNLKFNSTKTIHEMEVLVSAKEDEFNYSQNPSAVITELSGSYTFETTPITNTSPSKTVTIKEVKDKRRVEYYSGSYSSSISGSWDDYFDNRTIDPTGSYLAPFVTTIGLYDDSGNMVAVAKLPKPIKNLPDMPVNFLIRLDI